MKSKFTRVITATSVMVLIIAGGARVVASILVEAAQVKAVPGQEKLYNQRLAQRTEEETRIRVNEKASPAVVTIKHGDSLGSGFIVTRNGLVLTNAHVLEDAPSTVTVVLADGTEVLADVIGFHGQGLDLAGIKIRNQNNLPTVKLAATESVRVGQSVYAIGSPFGLERTFTSGVVSRIDRKRNWIQHDAAINPGNSGGPLLNSKAEVIGVNTLLINPNNESNTGISIAIAVEEVQPFLTALIKSDTSLVARQQPPRSNADVAIKELPIDGGIVTAKLKPGDDVLPNNTYYQIYAFKGQAGQQVTIEMNSKQIDSALFLVSSHQNKLIDNNDDISPNNFNARLVVTLPEDGAYYVIANAFEQGESGEYSLKATFK